MTTDSNISEKYCDCGAVSDGKFANVHSKNCTYVTFGNLQSATYRMHDMENCVIVLVDADGHGGEFCNTLNSFGDQRYNAEFILAAIKAYTRNTS
jgi:hypothetical protein